jgi:4,5-DOPA dioxygenase extradiol
MPVLFLGHGNPMNALAKNKYTEALSKLGKNLPTPKAILCVSAHWMTTGTWITSMDKPKTIHDFYGFPEELYKVQYPVNGSPEWAEKIQKEINESNIQADNNRGIDHGAWSVLVHMYPEAQIPVMQLSLDMSKPYEFHFKLGEELRKLRSQGILIIASGNIVHNLRKISWDEKAKPDAWAVEFDEWVKNKIESRDFTTLVSDVTKSEAGRLSVPTPDHYLPLLYILGASEKNDKINFEFEGFQNASISMRCIKFGYHYSKT